MTVGTIRPIARSRLSQEFLSVMISRRCYSALYGCLVHDFLPEVSHGSLARVQVPARHSRCGASKALRARGSPPSHSILLDLNSSQMVQGNQAGGPGVRTARGDPVFWHTGPPLADSRTAVSPGYYGHGSSPSGVLSANAPQCLYC